MLDGLVNRVPKGWIAIRGLGRGSKNQESFGPACDDQGEVYK